MVTPLCILLVDESAFFIELEKQFLRNTPSSIITAASGEEAIRLAREYRPSLVYMDMNMQGMSGAECCRMFKADNDLKDIPVVLVGESGSVDDEADSKSAGANAFMTKPLDRRVFLGVGHSFLMSIDRREPRQECRIQVEFLCRGRRMQGRCVDVSSGGMFLVCMPKATQGETLLLKFALPDEARTQLEIQGRIAWVNMQEKLIKEDYPLGYGVEFIEISDSAGTALRRCFGT